jgi:hypothetical protein
LNRLGGRLTNDWNFMRDGWSQPGQELSMQPLVERVIRAFTLKNSPSNENADGARRIPTELAAELLENYRAQLLQRAQNR